MLDRAEFIESFYRHFGSAGGAPQLFFCPGRVNLIGEHIDYNGGPVLPTTIRQGIYAAVRFRSDDTIRLESDQKPERISLNLADIPPFERNSALPERGWLNYPLGVLASIRKSGEPLSGAEILFWGDLPIGAGVSSSAALEVLTGYIFLHGPNQEPVDRIKLALRAQRVEREFVGVNCGIMDQFSVAVGKQGQAILLDCAKLEYRMVPASLSGLVLVVMNTNRPRELAGSKYNERRAECETALAEINRTRRAKGSPEYQELCQAMLTDLAAVEDSTVRLRAQHVVQECQRVKDAVIALENGDIKAFGLLMNRSHDSLKTNYEVTGPELDSIVAAAQAHPACCGARMTGAGFGGCAIALVEAKAVDAFIAQVGKRYTGETGLVAEFFSGEPVDGVSRLA